MPIFNLGIIASGGGGGFDPSANIAFTGSDSFSQNVIIPLVQTAQNQAASVQTVDTKIAAAGLGITTKNIASGGIDYTANFWILSPTLDTTFTVVALNPSVSTIFYVKNKSAFKCTLQMTSGTVEGNSSIDIPASPTAGEYFGYAFISVGSDLEMV